MRSSQFRIQQGDMTPAVSANAGRPADGGRPDAGAGAAPARFGTSPKVQTILVIDDDENLRDTVSLMLEEEGYRTVEDP